MKHSFGPPNLEITGDDIIASHFREPHAAFAVQGGIAGPTVWEPLSYRVVKMRLVAGS